MKIVLILCSFILASANARASQAEDYADAVSSAIFSSLYFNEQSGLKELSKLQSQPAITLSEGEMSALSSKVHENNFPYEPIRILTSQYEVAKGARSWVQTNSFVLPLSAENTPKYEKKFAVLLELSLSCKVQAEWIDSGGISTGGGFQRDRGYICVTSKIDAFVGKKVKIEKDQNTQLEKLVVITEI